MPEGSLCAARAHDPAYGATREKKSTKSAKVAKSTKKAVAVKKAVAPNQLHAKLIALMARKDGATIQDFQQVEGFAIPSMAVCRIAERHGYPTTVSKKQGERTRYYSKRT